MRERKSDGRFDATDREDGGEEDRNAVLVALVLAAVSGFVMGLIAQGAATMAVAALVLVPAMGCSGWWLRGAFEQHRYQTEP